MLGHVCHLAEDVMHIFYFIFSCGFPYRNAMAKFCKYTDFCKNQRIQIEQEQEYIFFHKDCSEGFGNGQNIDKE